jgi:hypothetical protein
MRNWSARAIRICNLIFASLAVLIILGGLNGCRWAGSSSPPRLHPFSDFMTPTGIIMSAIAISRLAGAFGLFSGKRLAWVGSVIGAVAATFSFASRLVGFFVIFIHPSAEIIEIRNSPNGGYIFVMVFYLTLFSLLLAFAVRLVIGLLHLRRTFSPVERTFLTPRPKSKSAIAAFFRAN